jgi:hypothetical protein
MPAEQGRVHVGTWVRDIRAETLTGPTRSTKCSACPSARPSMTT